jgi:hypothetical protein
MNKDLKLIQNFLQCVLCNSSRFHYLEPLKKGYIGKMTYLVEFWIILESDLIERAHTEYLLNQSETITKHTKYCTITNTFGITEFGSVLNKL